MNAEKTKDPKEEKHKTDYKIEHSLLWSRVLIGSTLFLLMGCSNAQKQETPASPPPQAPTAVSPLTPVPTTLPSKTATPVQMDKQAKSLTCKRDSDIRVLEVEPVQPKGCKLWYNRLGSKSSVASSEKSTAHCENVLTRMQKSLEVVQFKCTVGSISQEGASPSAAATSAAATATSTITTTSTTMVSPTTTTTTLKK